MAKMYIYNSSDTLNLIVSLSTYSFNLIPKSYHAVDDEDPMVAKFLGWYPELSLVTEVPEEGQKKVQDFIGNSVPQVNQSDLAKTAKALEEKMNQEIKSKQDELSSTAKALEDEQKHKEDIKASMLEDTAKALEDKQKAIAEVAKIAESVVESGSVESEPEQEQEQESQSEPEVKAKRNRRGFYT